MDNTDCTSKLSEEIALEILKKVKQILFPNGEKTSD